MKLWFESGLPSERAFAAWFAETEWEAGSDATTVYERLVQSTQVWCSYDEDRLVGLAYEAGNDWQPPVVLPAYRGREVASTLCKLVQSKQKQPASALLYA